MVSDTAKGEGGDWESAEAEEGETGVVIGAVAEVIGWWAGGGGGVNPLMAAGGGAVTLAEMGNFGVGMAEEMHSCRRLVSTPTDSMLNREEKEELSASLVLLPFPSDFGGSAATTVGRSTKIGNK